MKFENNAGTNQDWAIGIWGDDLRFVEEGEATRMALVDGGSLAIGLNFLTPGSMLGLKGNASIGSTYATSSAPTNGLLVEGNVGIGTSSPGFVLDIFNSSDATIRVGGGHADLQLDRATTSEEALVRFKTATVDDWIIGTDNVPAGNVSDFSIKTTQNAGAEFVIKTSGNVGIGTASPNYRDRGSVTLV